MKKIITALTVTAMALSAVFADVSLEFTQHAILLGDSGNLDFNGYSGKYDGHGAADGNWKFAFKNSNAGVQLTVKPSLTDKFTHKKDDKKDAPAVKASDYYGWTKFFDGAMTLQAGVWETRSANRFTTFAGKIQGNQYERYKLGVANGTVAKDINSLSGKALAAQVKYVADDGLWLTGALLDGDYDSKSGIQQKAGFAAEFGTSLGEGSSLIVDFKNAKEGQFALAGFFENKTFKEDLDFLVGFSFGRTDTQKIEYGVDFRARYDLADNIALITMNNLSYYGYKVTDSKTEISSADAETFALWNMVSLTATLSEKLTAIFTVEWEHTDLLNTSNIPQTVTNKDNEDTVKQLGFTQATLDLAPMVKYQIGKGADITAGAVIHTFNWVERKPTDAYFEIPLMLHVSL